jgi:hypothetical protein
MTSPIWMTKREKEINKSTSGRNDQSRAEPQVTNGPDAKSKRNGRSNDWLCTRHRQVTLSKRQNADSGPHPVLSSTCAMSTIERLLTIKKRMFQGRKYNTLRLQKMFFALMLCSGLIAFWVIYTGRCGCMGYQCSHLQKVSKGRSTTRTADIVEVSKTA